MGIRQFSFSCGRIASLVLAVVILAGSTFATTEKLVYTFLGSPDGVIPAGGLVADATGNLYGTTEYGGFENFCCGTVFELSPPATSGGAWTETILHTFGSNEGSFPTGTLIFDKAGNLYGTTFGDAGTSYGGSVFELSPPTTPGGAWTETLLHIFNGSDGDRPSGKLAIDAQGNIYGTTSNGGVAFELVKTDVGRLLDRENYLLFWSSKERRFPTGTRLASSQGDFVWDDHKRGIVQRGHCFSAKSQTRPLDRNHTVQLPRKREQFKL
jgi:hypothetical protein